MFIVVAPCDMLFINLLIMSSQMLPMYRQCRIEDASFYTNKSTYHVLNVPLLFFPFFASQHISLHPEQVAVYLIHSLSAKAWLLLALS